MLSSKENDFPSPETRASLEVVVLSFMIDDSVGFEKRGPHSDHSSSVLHTTCMCGPECDSAYCVSTMPVTLWLTCPTNYYIDVAVGRGYISILTSTNIP